MPSIPYVAQSAGRQVEGKASRIDIRIAHADAEQLLIGDSQTAADFLSDVHLDQRAGMLGVKLF